MKRFLVILGLIFIFFVAEFVLFNVFGLWATPNLLLLLVIFFSVFTERVYALFSAVCAGIFMDAFDIDNFGEYIFAFLVCFYITVLLRRFIFHSLSLLPQLLLVSLVCFVDFLVHFILRSHLINSIEGQQLVCIIKDIFLPRLGVTLIVTSFVFKWLKRCVSGLFV